MRNWRVPVLVCRSSLTVTVGGEPPLCRNRSLLPEARHIMKEIFERFSVEGCMSKAELTAYFAACGVGDSNVSDER